MQKILLAISLILLSIQVVVANDYIADTSDHTHWWLKAGIIGSMHSKNIDGSGSGAVIAASFSQHRQIFTIRTASFDNRPNIFSRMSTCVIFPFLADCKEVDITNTTKELALLYGKQYRHGKFSLSGGLARVTQRTPPNTLDQTIGLPLQVHLRLTNGRFFNSGLDLFANINKINRFSGIFITVKFGNLK